MTLDPVLEELGITFFELLTKTNVELAEAGLEPSAISDDRARYTGHRRPLSAKWAKSVGCWGRVQPTQEVATRVGVPFEQVKTYRSRWKLRTAMGEKTITPERLAAALYFDRARPVGEVSRDLGVLPAEAVLYRYAFQRMLDATGFTGAEVLKWTWDDLGEAWRVTEATVHPPEWILPTRTKKEEYPWRRRSA